MDDQETCPLPADPALAALALALNDAGYWATIVDRDWRNLYMTDALRLSYGGLLELAPFPVGVHSFGPEAVDARVGSRGGLFTPDTAREQFAVLGPICSRLRGEAARNCASSWTRDSATSSMSSRRPMR